LNEFLRSNLSGILWGLFIIILCAIPGTLIPEPPEFLDLFQPDKLVHLFLFAILVILWFRGVRKQSAYPWLRRNYVVATFLLAALLGGGTELIQIHLIPGRVASVYDFIANLAGCLVGWGAYILYNKGHRRK
jgi:VanZ family protein